MAVDAVTLGFAFGAGVATFFSPCSVGLLPAYAGYYAGTERAEGARGLASFFGGLRFGGAAALGILLVTLGGGALVYLLRTGLRLSSEVLAATFESLGLAVGVLLIVLGVVLLLPNAPSLAVRLRLSQKKTFAGMVSFGGVYALASVGCTLPLLFAVMAQAFTLDLAGGFLVFAAFGSGLATLMLAIGIAVSLAHGAVSCAIRSIVPYVKPASGVLMILAGAYVVVYYVVLVPR